MGPCGKLRALLRALNKYNNITNGHHIPEVTGHTVPRSDKGAHTMGFFDAVGDGPLSSDSDSDEEDEQGEEVRAVQVDIRLTTC